MKIPWKYKVVCSCGCGGDTWGYGYLRNIYVSVKQGALRSVPYPYFGFLTKRAKKGLRRWWDVRSYKLSIVFSYVGWLFRRR